jgi:hypothetical protein
MWPNWKCPWCEKAAPQLGARPTRAQTKWYKFSQTIAVCPHCNQPVKHSKKGQAWLLLVFPLLLTLVSEAATFPTLYVSHELYIFLFTVAVIGAVLFRVTTRLEKSDDI